MRSFALPDRTDQIQSYAVTADQMRQIEERVFAAGMPVAALMEKVAGLITQRLVSWLPQTVGTAIGVVAGPGHNGGDALVVARELHLQGAAVRVYCPFERLKELTQQHAAYARSLGIPFVASLADLQPWDVLVDGLFGFGLERAITGEVAAAIDEVNQCRCQIVSLDLPSGLHTDTGQVMGTAVRATHTLCLGLWKRGLLQDHALEYVGNAELVDFGLPLADIQAVLGKEPALRRITSHTALSALPLPRSPVAHKYTAGHLLLVVGSQCYAGAAVLAGLAARASGVGMLSIAVPTSLKPLLLTQLPEAVILACPETDTGAIAHLPDTCDLKKYTAIAAGCGLTLDAANAIRQLLTIDKPLLLDADGLNLLAECGIVQTLQERSAPTVLTPHLGEFRRLFPDLAQSLSCRLTVTRNAASSCGAIVLLKGARVVISDGMTTWVNPNSTPALARGGSGDVLTGLLGGLLAQPHTEAIATVQAGTWWHAQAGQLAAQERTELGVDAHTLARFLIPALQKTLG